MKTSIALRNDQKDRIVTYLFHKHRPVSTDAFIETYYYPGIRVREELNHEHVVTAQGSLNGIRVDSVATAYRLCEALSPTKAIPCVIFEHEEEMCSNITLSFVNTNGEIQCDSDSKQELKKLLHALGAQKLFSLHKVRHSAYIDGVTIHIDEIENFSDSLFLGSESNNKIHEFLGAFNLVL